MSKMKKLEELGISPAPWEVDNTWTGEIICLLKNGIEYQVATPYIHSDEETDANAHMLAAAPELYECLREEFEKVCTNDGKCTDCQFVSQCRVKKWRTALAKASGEDK